MIYNTNVRIILLYLWINLIKDKINWLDDCVEEKNLDCKHSYWHTKKKAIHDINCVKQLREEKSIIMLNQQ